MESIMPIVSGSVDRLDQVPSRLSFLFEFSPEQALANRTLHEEMTAAVLDLMGKRKTE